MNSSSSNAARAAGPAWGYVLAVTAAAIWGSPPVVTRAVSGDIPPLALSFARWLVALVILLPFVRKRLRSEWPRLRPHLASLVALAAFMTGGSTLSVVAVYFTTATNAVLVNASQPAVTAVIAWAVGRERLTPLQGVGVGCAFMGILLMISRADVQVLASLSINIGDLVMLGAVVCWSFYAVNLDRREYVPPPDVVLFVIALTSAVVLLPLYLVELAFRGGFEWGGGVVASMLYLAVFPTLLAISCWNVAVQALGPNRAAVFVNLIPVFGALLAIVFLGERLFLYHLLGAAFVSTGIYLAVRKRRAGRVPSRSRA